jgi:hypothetical protein
MEVVFQTLNSFSKFSVLRRLSVNGCGAQICCEYVRYEGSGTAKMNLRGDLILSVSLSTFRWCVLLSFQRWQLNLNKKQAEHSFLWKVGKCVDYVQKQSELFFIKVAQTNIRLKAEIYKCQFIRHVAKLVSDSSAPPPPPQALQPYSLGQCMWVLQAIW